MSKRAGNVILLRDLVEEFGIDVVRWFFNEKALSTQMAFDMALARDASDKNPVYYVQYAHARLVAIAEKARVLAEAADTQSFKNLMAVPSARALASKIIEFPEVVSDVARDYTVQAITTYATALAQCSNAFYRDVRVITDDGYNGVALALSLRAKETLIQTLNLLGISSPDKM